MLAAIAGCAVTRSHIGTADGIAQSSRAPASNSDRWQIVYRTSTRQTDLLGIASVSTTDAWAAGLGSSPRSGSVVLHWNGISWRPVRLPGARGFLPNQIMASGAGNVWIFGPSHAGGQWKLYRFDGTRWRTVPLPPGHWSNNLAGVTGGADAWLAGGGCKSRSWPWNCSSTIEQWTGTRWIASHVRVLVSALAAVGGRIWAVGVTGKRPPHGGDGTGQMVLLQQAGARWQPMTAPAESVGGTSRVTLPQLTAGANGSAWILCYKSDGGADGQGTLFHWDAGHWTPIPIPAKAGRRVLYVGTQLTTDGRIGVWAGPTAHWTGQRWVSVSTVRPGPAGAVFLSQAAGIPGAAGSWAVGGSGGFITSNSSGRGVIALNGPLPG